MKEDLMLFQTEFNEINKETTSTSELWHIFKEKMNDLMEKYIPTKLSKKKHKLPYFNGELSRLNKTLHKSYRKRNVSSKANKHYKSVKALFQRKLRKAYWDYIEQILDFEKADSPSTQPTHKSSKQFWSFIKSQRQENFGVAPLRENGVLVSDPQEKAEILNNQFSSVFTSENTPAPSLGTSPHPPMPDIEVTIGGVHKLLSCLNPNKAQGPDCLHPKLLKTLANEIAPILTVIFQHSLNTGDVPSDWRQGNIAPIFKKGDKHKPSNYRPVSLTSICSKLIEHIVVSNVRRHLDKHSILADEQHGFRSKRSCETQLITFVQELFNKVAGGGQVDAVVLDFSKAFDKVPHSRLMNKLDFYGIRNKAHVWVGAFLNNRQQCVVLDGFSSTSAKVLSGVPQGTVLGPTLFLLFINDLPQYCKSSVRLFADDCVLYREIRSSQDSIILQQDLDALHRWEQEWLMEFNAGKCFVLNITRKRIRSNNTYNLHNTTLQTVESTTYLGVEISNNLNWSPHIDKVVKKGNRSLGFVRRNIKTSNSNVKTLAYNALVRPILEYSCQVWDPHTNKDIQKLESVQRRAARYATNRYHNTSSPTEMIRNLGWDSLKQRRAKIRLATLYKIMFNLVEIPREQFLIPTTSTYQSHCLNFQRPTTTTNYLKYSFFPRTIAQWNSLPYAIQSSPTLEGFKSLINEASIPDLKC